MCLCQLIVGPCIAATRLVLFSAWLSVSQICICNRALRLIVIPPCLYLISHPQSCTSAIPSEMPFASLGLQFTTRSVPQLNQKVFIVTGGNVGIGREAANVLAARDAHVIIAGAIRYSAGTLLDANLKHGNAVLSFLEERRKAVSCLRQVRHLLAMACRAVEEIHRKAAGPHATVEWMQCDTTSFRCLARYKAWGHSLGCMHACMHTATPS